MIEDKIQYGKLNRDDNIYQIRNELQARNIQYENTATWTDLLGLLKIDEDDDKYFLPRTDYHKFIISDLQRPEISASIKYSDLLKNDNITVIWEELSLREVQHVLNTSWKDIMALLKAHECHPKKFVPRLPTHRFIIKPP